MEKYPYSKPNSLEEAIPRLNYVLYEAEIFQRPAKDEIPLAGDVLVDMEIMRVTVSLEAALRYRPEVAEILSLYPGNYYRNLPPLEEDPSYLHAGAALDSQRSALLLFAYGEVVGFWQVITPKRIFGNMISDEMSAEMIRLGYLTISGYRAPVEPD